MAYTTIKKPSDYFNTKLYTGNLSTNNITGVGFQPDLVWLKSRAQGTTGYNGNHYLFDAVRGATKWIISNQTGAEANNASSLSSFDSDGFTLGALDFINNNGDGFASWNWLASNTTASNTDGSITSTVSANTTSGFSIVSYTGTGSAATVGHGLGSDLKMVIIKNRDAADNWEVYHSSVITSDNQTLNLDNTNALFTRGTASWDISEFSSSVIGLNTNSAVNSSSVNYIAYCFSEVKGFSKFGSYIGNGSTDGTFCFTGFKPAFAVVKCTTTTSQWVLLDNKRNTYNVMNTQLYPNQNYADSPETTWDFVSNGIKIRNNNGNNYNLSGATYIYMAFAEEPLVGDNPATAR